MLFTPSYSFLLFNALTLGLVFQKVELHTIDWSWICTLAPTFIFLIYQMLSNFSHILFIDVLSEEAKTKNLKLVIVDSLHKLLQNVLLFVLLIIVAEVLETAPEKRSLVPLFGVAAIQLGFHLLYTVMHNRLTQAQTLLPVSRSPGLENKEAKSEEISFFASLMTPIFNFLGSSFTICAGGSCNAIYGSTLSAIFGAFGISITEWLPYLDGVTGILIVISVYMLYDAKKDWKYKPFLLSLVAAVLIIFHMLTHQYKALLYIGNAMMIGAAIWNIKLNRVKFGRAKKKNTA